jgi:hypothetical protein
LWGVQTKNKFSPFDAHLCPNAVIIEINHGYPPKTNYSS